MKNSGINLSFVWPTSGTEQAIRRALQHTQTLFNSHVFPYWTKITATHTDFQKAATTNTIELYSLPAAGVIHAVKIKHSVAFAGGSISAYTLKVGITGTTDKYASAFDVFQAVSGTAMQLSSTVGTENHGAVTSIKITADSTGANLSATTAGSVDVWLLISEAA